MCNINLSELTLPELKLLAGRADVELRKRRIQNVNAYMASGPMVNRLVRELLEDINTVHHNRTGNTNLLAHPYIVDDGLSIIEAFGDLP